MAEPDETGLPPGVTGPGTAAVRSTVRRRRTVQTAALGLLSALIIAVPLATYAVSSHSNHAPPLTGAAPAPSLSVSVSDEPTTAPSTPDSPVPSVSPGPSVSPSTPVPTFTTGQLTPADLVNAHAPVPAWHVTGVDTSGLSSLCTGNNKTLEAAAPGVDVNHMDPGTISIMNTVYTNLDADPDLETAALLVCQYGEAAADMVVGYDINAAGKVVSLGTIAAGHIWSLNALPGGGVTIDISDSQACCDTPRAHEEHQTRSYGWSGSHFRQVAGPTEFISHPHVVFSVSTASHGWSAAKDGFRTGTITVIIKNTSAVTSNSILVSADAPGDGSAIKVIPGLAPGASGTVTLTVDVSTDTQASDARVYVYEIGSQTDTWNGSETPYPLWK